MHGQQLRSKRFADRRGLRLLLVRSFLTRLALGGALALSGSVAGLCLSFAGDFPAGPVVVAMLGALPLVAGVLRLALR